MSLRFQFDEHIPPNVATELARRGIDALTAKAAGLLNTSDAVILQHASNERRVVVTFDADYARLHALGQPHAGIAYFPNAPQDVGALVNALVLLNGVMEPDEFMNRLEYV